MATDRGRRTHRGKQRTHARASSLGKVRLAAEMQLKDGKDGGESAVLVGPAGSVQLNSSAVAILKLCDGSRSRAEVMAELVRSSHPQLKLSDVGEFLDAARARGWIDEAEATGGP